MTLPSFTDFFALLGIAIALCATGFRLLQLQPWLAARRRWIVGGIFIVLWVPAGGAFLPLLAYVRGISSDLSVTLVALAGLFIYRDVRGLAPLAIRERVTLDAALAAGAVLLYPLALGAGDWDFYRTGWGSFGLWSVLAVLSIGCWIKGLRLLPCLVALSLLAWTGGFLESGNLWDYLMDPWLAVYAISASLKRLIFFRRWSVRARTLS